MGQGLSTLISEAEKFVISFCVICAGVAIGYVTGHVATSLGLFGEAAQTKARQNLRQKWSSISISKREEYEYNLQELKQKMEATHAKLKSEPKEDHPDAIRIIVKLPNGTRLERRFLKQDSLIHLYGFVFSHPETPELFQIIRVFPKRTLPLPKGDNDADSGIRISTGGKVGFAEVQTFDKFGITSNELLHVYSMP